MGLENTLYSEDLESTLKTRTRDVYGPKLLVGSWKCRIICDSAEKPRLDIKALDKSSYHWRPLKSKVDSATPSSTQQIIRSFSIISESELKSIISADKTSPDIRCSS